MNDLSHIPIDEIPKDLAECNEASLDTIDSVMLATGPELLEDQPAYTEPVQAFVESSLEEPLQIDRVQAFVRVDWPQNNPKPINEFEFDGLASLLFPKLFPLGKGDPTKKARMIKVSETDGFKHLLKYATINSQTKELYYPFAQHPRFKFWAYDRLRRHRALDQCKIYLKQNLGN
jgi:hypothetical protein